MVDIPHIIETSSIPRSHTLNPGGMEPFTASAGSDTQVLLRKIIFAIRNDVPRQFVRTILRSSNEGPLHNSHHNRTRKSEGPNVWFVST